MTHASLLMEGVSKTFLGAADRQALSDISLRVESGEAVAVIGRNGAGKSTLLKVAAGIVAPSSGRIRRVRRTASLIELGMAFHPDLTGSENLELALAIAGVPRRRHPSTIDAVIEFSGLRSALGRQVKHYSNGMVARLACAIAVHTEPELLLVDEVLAVGDATFQRAMVEAIAEQVERGCALVLVTHSPQLASACTERAVWLAGGATVEAGPTRQILDRYEADTFGTLGMAPRRTLRFRQLTLEPDAIEVGGALEVTVDLEVHEPTGPLRFRLELRPVVGDGEVWMRSPDELIEHRHLNLLAASEPINVTDLSPGHHRIRYSLDRVPVTPTLLELSVVAAGPDGRLVDLIASDLAIGSVAGRPFYDLHLGFDSEIVDLPAGERLDP